MGDKMRWYFVRFRSQGRRRAFMRGIPADMKLKLLVKPVDACLNHPESRLFYEGEVLASDEDNALQSLNLYYENVTLLKVHVLPRRPTKPVHPEAA